MKRISQGVLGVAVLVAIVVGTAGCGSTDVSAFSVDGHHVSQSDVNDELRALRDNATFRSELERQGQTVSVTPQSVTSSLSSGWVTTMIQDELIQVAIAERHVKVGSSDRATALQSAYQAFGSKATFLEFPKSFRDNFVARRARALALAADAGADLTTQDGVNTLVGILVKTEKGAHVTVDPRYGTWNERRLEVVAPRAPGSPKTRTVNPNSGG